MTKEQIELETRAVELCKQYPNIRVLLVIMNLLHRGNCVAKDTAEHLDIVQEVLEITRKLSIHIWGTEMRTKKKE